MAYIFYQKALRWLDSSPHHHLSISWSPGHTKIRGNEKADKLVKEAAKIQSQFNTTTTSASRRAHEYMLTKWKWIWRNQPQNGRYGPANRIPPSLQPTPHFKALRNQREIFGRLIQCRTGHGYFGDYYRSAVPSENISCPCGEEIQTCKHIIDMCPQYENHRQILRNISNSIYARYPWNKTRHSCPKQIPQEIRCIHQEWDRSTQMEATHYGRLPSC